MTNRSMGEIVRRQKPVSLPARATVQEACRTMRDKRIGAILVVDEAGRLVGLFTGRDAVIRVGAEALDPATTTLEQVMTRDPDTTHPRTRAIEVLRVMSDAGYRHLPILEEGRIVGIVSKGDFLGLEHARHDEETGFWEVM